MTKKYDSRIDIAKGIGMILLVAGHLLTIDSPGFKIIFSFHMPLFFFLSGYLFSGTQRDIVQFFKSKISKLVISYLFFILVGILFYILIFEYSRLSMKSFFISTCFYGEPDVNNNLWFLCTLMYVMIIYHFIPKLSSRDLKPSHCFAIIFICLIISQVISLIPTKYIPFKLYTVPLAFIFFFCGNRIQDLYKITTRNGNVKKCIFVGGGILLIITSLLNSRVDLRLNMSGNPVLFLIGGMSGIAVVVSLSDMISNTILVTIGKWSIVFFPMEAYVRVFVNKTLNFITDSHYTPMINLPVRHALIEFPIILICLILIVKYFTPLYRLFIDKLIHINTISKSQSATE